MLPKLSKEIDSTLKARIEKLVLGVDKSSLGAFAYGEQIEIRMTLPRRIGALGVVLRIARDGGAERDITLERKKLDEVTDLFSCILDTRELCGESGCGLFYY